MTDAGTFARHARVLLDAAPEGDAERVVSELEGFAALLREQPEVSRPLFSAAVEPARKADAVRAIARAAAFGPMVTTLLARLAERHQLAAVPLLAVAARARLLERRNIVAAEVTTAVRLEDAQTAAIARRLGEVTGKDVRVSARVDPSIVGGVVAKIGSLVYDGSVTRRLARMRQKLVENV
jgi:F-type H+-transporting ATPase subunit delta